MATERGVRAFLVLFFVVASAVSTAEASGMDTGDAMALVLGIMITVFGTCACLGVYARKRNGMQ